jgi:hypothetical protein
VEFRGRDVDLLMILIFDLLITRADLYLSNSVTMLPATFSNVRYDMSYLSRLLLIDSNGW